MYYSNNPLVSVCLITYNHEAFISQAIEGILIQKTNFPIELIIGEDCSIDETRKICIAYQQKYPKIIRVLPREKNLGVMFNFINTLSNCRGKYIAMCEGDDYWTDPLKLQKQINFLEANPECSCHFHNVNKLETISGKIYPFLNLQKTTFTTRDTVDGWNYPTGSLVFRNIPELKTILNQFSDAIGGDVILTILLSHFGHLKYSDEIMGVYRIHKNGFTSVIDKELWNKNNLTNLKKLNICLNKRYKTEFRKRFFKEYGRRSLIQSKAGKYSFLLSLLRCLIHINLYKQTKIFVKDYLIDSFFLFNSNKKLREIERS